MLYSCIRFIITAALFILLLILIKKFNLNKKVIVYFLHFTLVSLIGLLLYWFPFENMFIHFSSPEDVFKYTCVGDIKDIVYGNNSCMIVYTNYNGLQTCFVKKDDYYKIVTYPQYYTTNLVSKDRVDMEITTIKDIDDNYCLGTAYNKKNIKITDNKNSEFFYINSIDDNSDNSNIYRFYSFINDYDETYELFYNSKKIDFVKL